MGMHCHGGTRGGGYEILYLWCRLKAALLSASDLGSPESSEEIMFGVAREESWVDEPLPDDRAVVRAYDGSYHLTTALIVTKMKALRKSKSWVDEMEADDLERELASREDYIPESVGVGASTFSGESQRPVEGAQSQAFVQTSPLPQASNCSVGCQASAPTEPPKSTRTGLDFSKLPLQHMTISELRTLVSRVDRERARLGLLSRPSSKMQQRSTSRQTQAPKPNGKALSLN